MPDFSDMSFWYVVRTDDEVRTIFAIDRADHNRGECPRGGVGARVQPRQNTLALAAALNT